MKKILGLDLGTSSIGWALIDELSKKILKCGVMKFAPAIDINNPISPAAARRVIKSTRKGYFRKTIRKNIIKKFFIEKNIFTSDFDWDSFIKLDPYNLRDKALNHPITTLEFARICYHIGQRRGFKGSNKTEASTNESNKLFAGYDNFTGISQTKEELEKGNYKTIGQYFFFLDKNETSIRRRFLTRQMYVDEFNAIWKNQQKYNNPFFNDDDNFKILGHPKTGLLFYQRPLKSQKDLIGKCRFETNKHRVSKSHIDFEKFNMLHFINNIRIINEDGQYVKLNTEQKTNIISLYHQKESFKFKDVINVLGYSKKALKDKDITFNFAADYPLKGNITHIRLAKLFGEDIWNKKTYDEKLIIWNTIMFGEDDWLLNYAVEKWHFTSEQCIQLQKTHLIQEYSELSRNAINKILEFFELGYENYDAILLAGVKNALSSKWNSNFSQDVKDRIIKEVLELKNINNGNTLFENLIDYLTINFSLSVKELKKLYNPSESGIIFQNEGLHIPQKIKNPAVNKSLHKIKKLVQTLTNTYGQIDEIRIEMARDFGQSIEQIQKITSDNYKKNKENNLIKEQLNKLGVSDRIQNIKKYRLFKECQGICIYSGKEILEDKLFNDEIDIEHIVPKSILPNSSSFNLTLCFREDNQKKGNRTPYEAYNTDSEKWSEIKSRARKVFSPNKYSHFINAEVPKFEDFVTSQLNDTRYICKQTAELLKGICKNVSIVNGKSTSRIRRAWGLQEILGDDESKNTLDNRNHVIDAIVIAFTDRKLIHRLYKPMNTINLDKELEFLTPYKRQEFIRDVTNEIMAVIVHHDNKQKLITTRKIIIEKNGTKNITRGHSIRQQLHDANIFGKISIGQNKFEFAKRKNITAFDSPGSFKKIVDAQVKRSIETHLKNNNFDLNKENWTKEDKKMLANILKLPVFLLNKKGEKVRQIKKVRCSIDSTTSVSLKSGQNAYVKPNNNVFSIIEKIDGRWNINTISFFNYVQSYFGKANKISLKENNNRFFLKKNDLVLLDLPHASLIETMSMENISKNIYRVRKIDGAKITLISHLFASVKDVELIVITKSNIESRMLKKIEIDYLGNITCIEHGQNGTKQIYTTNKQFVEVS